jgi:thioredoxin 1
MSDYVNNIREGDFEKNVLQSSQPVLVDFWAEWCGPCRMLGPTVEAVAKQYAGSATVVKLNVDESPGVAARYGVRGIPTLILFKDGQEAERVVGAVPKETISRLIDKHVEGGVAS